MIGKIEIDYAWWPAGGQQGDEVPRRHRQSLLEAAEDHIIEMMKEGYMAGELNETIAPSYIGDPADGFMYRGHWNVRKGGDE
jgi:hypothetical protein